jgi:hypothetical protein
VEEEDGEVCEGWRKRMEEMSEGRRRRCASPSQDI